MYTRGKDLHPLDRKNLHPLLNLQPSCTSTRLGVEYSPSMLEPVRPGAASPDRALCLPTFSDFVIVNKTSLSLSLSLLLEHSKVSEVQLCTDQCGSSLPAALSDLRLLGKSPLAAPFAPCLGRAAGTQREGLNAGIMLAHPSPIRWLDARARARFPRWSADPARPCARDGPGASVRSGCRPEPVPFVRKNYISSSSSSSANSWSPPKRSAFRSLFTCMSGGKRGRQALAGPAAASRGGARHMHGGRSAHATYG
jgi:hypothetical protein